MSRVATDFHEVRGFLNWNQHGDSPNWAVRKLSLALGGGHSFETEIDGDTVHISLNYKKSGISPRPQDSVEEIYEYGIFWETEDGLRFGGYLKPRFDAREFRQKQPSIPFWDREKISTPKNLGEATTFQIVAGKYRPPSYYREMLPKVLHELAREAGTGWNSEYQADPPHESWPTSSPTTKGRRVVWSGITTESSATTTESVSRTARRLNSSLASDTVPVQKLPPEVRTEAGQ